MPGLKENEKKLKVVICIFRKFCYDNTSVQPDLKGMKLMQEKNEDRNAGIHTHSHSNAHEPHSHDHNHPNAKAVSNRLARAIGHLESVKRMVDDGEDCAQILIQLAAVRSAINNAGKVLLSDHINHCMVEAVENKDYAKIDELNDAIQKFVK